jgi:MscS family membrane protein
MDKKEVTEHILLTTVKNYLLVVLWIIYFIYYFSGNYKNLVLYIKEYIPYWTIILEYSNATMAFVTIIWVIWILNKVLKTVLEKIADKTTTNIDNVFVDYLNRSMRLNKYFIWLYIFFLFINIPEVYQFYIDKAFYIIFLIVFIYYFTNFLNISFELVLAKRTKFKSLNKSLLSFLRKIIVLSTWVIWIITILSNLWYNVTALITWAWIWGLAIALAAQKTLSNVFWAVTVLLTKPFSIGDYVKIDGQIWTIKEMWVSHLTMVDKEWYFVLIPNEKLISSNIENLTKRETRRTEFTIWIVYSTTILKTKKAIKIIEDILQEHLDNKQISHFRVNFDTFWDFSLNIRSTYFSLFTNSYKEYVKQKEEINLKIKDAFTKEKINMAFPTQELIIKKES